MKLFSLHLSAFRVFYVRTSLKFSFTSPHSNEFPTKLLIKNGNGKPGKRKLSWQL